jgi:hypothetical protein
MRLRKAGVGSKLEPPPNSGHSRVKKSCKWAAKMPLIWRGMIIGFINNDAMIMQYGMSWAGTVKKKKFAFIPRWSWTAV